MNKLIAFMALLAGVFSCNISAFTIYNHSALQFDEVYWVSSNRKTLIGKLGPSYHPMLNNIRVPLTKEQLGVAFGIKLINKDQNKEFYCDFGNRLRMTSHQDLGVIIFQAQKVTETQDDGIFMGIVKEQHASKTFMEILTLEPEPGK